MRRPRRNISKKSRVLAGNKTAGTSKKFQPKPFLKRILAGGAICTSLGLLATVIEITTWWNDNRKLDKMAESYAQVGKDIYQDEHNAVVALQFLENAIELDFNNYDFRYQKAYIDGMGSMELLLNLDHPFNKAQLDEAHIALAQAIMLKELNPKRAESYILEAQVHTALKNYDLAKKKIKHAISLSPTNSFAQVRLATIFFESRDFDNAQKTLNKTLKMDPKSKWAHLWRGLIFDEQKDYIQSRAAFKQALKIDPKFHLALYNVAWTWMRREKDYAKARDFLDKALTINPAYKEAYYAYSMSYGYENEYELGLIYANKALDLDADFLTARKCRALMSFELHDYPAAIKDYSIGIQLDPTDAELYQRRATAFEKMDELDLAMKDLRRALKLDPENIKILRTIGAVRLNAADYAGALKAFNQVLSKKAHDADTYARIADVKIAQKNYTQAIEFLDLAILHSNYHTERYHLKKGDVYEMSDENALATKAYQVARTQDQQLFAAWLGEARCTLKSNKISEAEIALSKCLELRPLSKEAQLLNGQLRHLPGN